MTARAGDKLVVESEKAGQPGRGRHRVRGRPPRGALRLVVRARLEDDRPALGDAAVDENRVAARAAERRTAPRSNSG